MGDLGKLSGIGIEVLRLGSEGTVPGGIGTQKLVIAYVLYIPDNFEQPWSKTVVFVGILLHTMTSCDVGSGLNLVSPVDSLRLAGFGDLDRLPPQPLFW